MFSRSRLSASLLVITSGLSSYVGAGFAVSLFAFMPATTVAWWRVTIGAVVLLAWRRPWRIPWSRRSLLTSAGFGVAMATMNVIFYAAIDHLALGTAVSLEFLGPVAVALLTGRGWRPRIAAIIALVGVASISGLGVDLGESSQRLGVALAICAGLSWAAYILLGRRVAAGGAASGIDSLSVAATTGALVYTPLAIGSAGGAFTSVRTVAEVIGVAVLSTVVPYALDQINLGRLSSATFALLMALMPATSLAVGIIMLGQKPNAWEIVGLVCVSIAVALAGSSPRSTASASVALTPAHRRVLRRRNSTSTSA